ncbi:hypothetical protein KAU09_01005 [Candidatus Parcubacteria bacterium]|nr:hypothetical protein [Candidatus Parcubacteria bacterium]
MKTFAYFVIFLVIVISLNFVNHKIRTYSQYHKNIYAVLTVLDLMDFVAAGGGPVGDNNYFKWCYAKWRNSPDRSILEKVLFWDIGFLYDANNLAEKYQYPLKV